MHFVDHLFIFLLFVVQPIHGAWEFRRYVRKIEAGEPADRAKLYREAAIYEWVALAALAATWYFLGRQTADLGFVSPGGTGFWIGIALLVVATGYMVYAWRAAKTMAAEDKAKQINSLGDLAHFLPQSDRDYRSFFGVSITAGIVEEIFYRGFMFWYLAQIMPMWAVIVVSSIAFGLAHSYQGAGGILRVTAVGLAFGGLYVLSGSIWLLIIGHALVDILQGAMVLEIYRGTTTPQYRNSTTADATN